MIKLTELILKEDNPAAVKRVKQGYSLMYTYVQGGRPQQKEVLTFFHMVKGNYKWKSDKQANYFYNQYARFADIQPISIKKNDIPEGTEMIFSAEMVITGAAHGVDFGRKSRVKEYVLYMNRNGLIRADQLKFGYNDKEGRSWLKGVEKGTPTGIKPYVQTPEENEKDREVAAKRKVWQKIKKSKYIGKPGEKMNLKLNFLNYNSFETQYGLMKIYMFYDDKFNVFVYKGSKSFHGDIHPRDDRYKSFNFQFKLKKHEEYNGTKQNVMERPKLL